MGSGGGTAGDSSGTARAKGSIIGIVALPEKKARLDPEQASRSPIDA